MSEHYEAVVTLPSLSGLPADEVVNTFSVVRDTVADPSALLIVANALQDFYGTTPPGQAHPVGYFLSPELTRVTDACSVRLYHRPATPGPSGSPVGFFSLTLPAVATQPALPGQDAVCLSMHANLTGIPESGPSDANIPTPESAQDMGAPAVHLGLDALASRRRGRVFIGPLNMAATAAGTHQESRPGGGFINTLASAANALDVALLDTSWDWEVFSRRDWAGYSVGGGWIDNRFDTQRRRLEGATARTTW